MEPEPGVLRLSASVTASIRDIGHKINNKWNRTGMSSFKLCLESAEIGVLRLSVSVTASIRDIGA